MPRKNNREKIGETNFLINFSNQENSNQNFDPSNHHYHNIFRKILIIIIAIIIIYFIGFGIYAIHHHMNYKSNRQTHVTRVVHHTNKKNKKSHPRVQKKSLESKRDRIQDVNRNKKQRTVRNNASTKDQINRTQNNMTRTTEPPTRTNTISNQNRR